MVLEELEKMKSQIASELLLERILSHGKEGAACGIIKMVNRKKHAFPEFSSAKGAKIKSISSYVIEI